MLLVVNDTYFMVIILFLTLGHIAGAVIDFDLALIGKAKPSLVVEDLLWRLFIQELSSRG